MAQERMERKRETMGRRLAAARALCGLSQAEAAERAGFAQPYLSLLENDKAASPSLNAVSKLAGIYGVSIDYLVRGEPAAPQPAGA